MVACPSTAGFNCAVDLLAQSFYCLTSRVVSNFLRNAAFSGGSRCHFFPPRQKCAGFHVFSPQWSRTNFLAQFVLRAVTMTLTREECGVCLTQLKFGRILWGGRLAVSVAFPYFLCLPGRSIGLLRPRRQCDRITTLISCVSFLLKFSAPSQRCLFSCACSLDSAASVVLPI